MLLFCIITDENSSSCSLHQLTRSDDFMETDTEYLQMARKGGGHSGTYWVIKNVAYCGVTTVVVCL